MHLGVSVHLHPLMSSFIKDWGTWRIKANAGLVNVEDQHRSIVQEGCTACVLESAHCSWGDMRNRGFAHFCTTTPETFQMAKAFNDFDADLVLTLRKKLVREGLHVRPVDTEMYFLVNLFI